MSELIEIDEDNCVLSESDLLNLKNMFSCLMQHGDKDALTPFKKILEKINKLNDLAKARQEEKS